MKRFFASPGEAVTSGMKVPYDVGAITVSADERWLVIGTYRTDRGQVAFFDLHTGKEIGAFQLHPQIVQGLAISPDGKYLATGDLDDPTINLWDLDAGTPLPPVRGHNLVVRSIAFSSDGSRMVTTSIGSEPIKVWDTSNWEEIISVGVPGTAFIDPRFLPDGNTLAAIDTSEMVHLWRAPSWTEIRAAESHGQEGQRR
jgi:WD40 repeat protein